MFSRFASLGKPQDGPATPQQRRVALVLAVLVASMAVIFWPAPAQAKPPCSLSEWRNPLNAPDCVSRLPPVNQAIDDCMGIPNPSAPDSGFGGWFASDPKVTDFGTSTALYTQYGYAGYQYPLYTPNCINGVNPATGNNISTSAANAELMLATGIVGASNAFRDKAYNPSSMWGWADKLVNTATKSIYQKVFSVFGMITLAIVGLYLIWRSRQSDMSDALTTAGWAVLVMIVVTAVALYPVNAAHLADGILLSTLGTVHDAIGPQPQVSSAPICDDPGPKPKACVDRRSPSLRASDMATEAILYDNWLRGTIGSSTSTTAQKYGPSLYAASSLSWSDEKKIQQDPAQRVQIIQQKKDDWQKLANQIKTEDPEAYDYMQGNQGSARLGAGLIAIISAVGFGFFDIAASLLIILGFLIFRWAVVALPVIGTIALLRPASGGFKRLVNIVVAAIFNIVIFGVGGSVYLFAVNLILNTASLPGWLQLTLVWLCGVVGWLLLRPYRRITQLGGKSSLGEVAAIGSWHRKFFGDLKDVALGAGGAAAFGDVRAGKETKGKGRKSESGDVDQPAQSEEPRDVPMATGDGTEGPLAIERAPSKAPPAEIAAGRPAAQPVRNEPRSGPRYIEGYAASGRDNDDKVWVPETDRYANGERAEIVALVDANDERVGDAAERGMAELNDFLGSQSRT